MPIFSATLSYGIKAFHHKKTGVTKIKKTPTFEIKKKMLCCKVDLHEKVFGKQAILMKGKDVVSHLLSTNIKCC